MFYKKREVVEGNPEAPSSRNTHSSDSSEKAFLRGLTQDEHIERSEQAEELELVKLKKSVNAEIQNFTIQIKSNEFKSKTWSRKKFWIRNQDALPQLYKLAVVLSNIQCSAAFIERYLSQLGKIFGFLFLVKI